MTALQRASILAVLLVALTIGRAGAHHAFSAVYDDKQTITVEGVDQLPLSHGDERHGIDQAQRERRRRSSSRSSPVKAVLDPHDVEEWSKFGPEASAPAVRIILDGCR